LLNPNKLKEYKLDNKLINLIDIELDLKKSENYIKKCFITAFKILKSDLTNKFINGPINKSSFLNKKFLGITEYISNKFNISNVAMLIYNKNLSVCPLTTHLPIKLVTKKINQKSIKDKTKLINDFYVKNLGFKPKIAVTGLNPHCETVHEFNEDQKIIKPAVKKLKQKGYRIEGPFSSDTIFLKQNRKRYNVILGMYHDQVLSPIKALKEYDAINITLGLPFYRISPDHGPNEKMINKNSSNPLSLIQAIKFLEIK
jgi:4-hydroxythreonine-4-phosphate dehydrogenase